MTTQNFSTLIAAGLVATGLGIAAQPADAFVITNTSGTWDNVTTDGGLIGSDGAAASADNLIKFLDVDGQSQVRWGKAAYGGYYQDNWETVTENKSVPVYKTVKVPKTNRWGGVKKNRRGQIQYKNKSVFSHYKTQTVTKQVNNKVWVPPTYENQSGLGYKGVSNLNLEVGEIFNIGSLTHFNQGIYYSDYIGKSAEFSLAMDFGDNSIGAQKFDFTFSIDETLNSQEVCPYYTIGSDCSDKITWDFNVDQQNTFTYEDEEYTLELVGFADQLATSGALNTSDVVNDFISQEKADNSAGLFARLVKVDTTKDIPEPASLLGLAGLGLYFARSRKKNDEKLAAV